MKRAAITFFTLFTASAFASAQEPIRLATDPALSPDGQTLYFSWRGDIWSVATAGGEAKPLTLHPAGDAQPHVSPDGSEVAFISDRSGSRQVWVVSARGGAPKQITHHTAGHSLHGWTPDGTNLVVRRLADTYWRSGSRFFLVNRAERRAPKMIFDAYGTDGDLSPDGSRMLFMREGVRWWRKGYTGTNGGQIWSYSVDGNFKKLLAPKGGARWPLWKPDGEGFYYTGARNLFDFGSGKHRQITHYKDDPVLFPCVSRDGSTLVFRHLFDFYRIHPGREERPVRIAITNNTDVITPTIERRLLKSATAVAFSNDGLEIALIAGGDLWVLDTELKEPRQITSSPEEERNPVFSKDGKTLYFVSDSGGRSDIHKAERGDAEKYWWQNETFTVTPMTEDEEVETRLRLSPDGQHLSFVRGNDLYLLSLKDSKATRLVESWNAPQYDWSPDSKWIVYARADNDYNRDIWVTPIDGHRPPFNLSRHPDNESSPKWSPDGKTIAFTGRRYDDEVDIYYIPLTKELSEEEKRDRTITKAIEKLKKARKKKESKKEGSKEEGSKEEGGKKEEEKKTKDVVIDFEDIHKRIQRISIAHTSESNLVWSNDSKKLAFSATIDGKAGTYTVSFPDEIKPKLLSTKTGSQGRWIKAGIVWLSGGSPALLDSKGKATEYKFSARQIVDRVKHQRTGFLLAWRTMRDIFYDERFNNRDWDAIREKYQEPAAQAPDRSSFQDTINMMLGELNASHMGFSARRNAWTSGDAWSEVTPHLGVRWDADHAGPGLKVRDVIPRSPASREKSRLNAGDTVLKIDGTPVDPKLDLTTVLNGALDRDIRLRVRNPRGEERNVLLRPISYTAISGLLYRKWVEDNQKAVENASGGKLGYVHIRGMNWSSFQQFEAELYSIGHGKDGIVIDVRENGGGWTTDHLLTVLSQPKHAVTVGRGGGPGYPQDRKVYASWHKPIIVLCNQNSYSNAEIFSHAIKSMKRGKVVGVATSGSVISTSSRSIMDLGRIRTPLRGWYVAETGEDMELNGAVPHFVVWPEPGEMPKGQDRQLQKAIDELLIDVKAWNARPRPKLRKASERGK